MLATPLLTATLEAVLNRLLFRDSGMKAARLRLSGRVLRVELKEFNTPLSLIFSEKKVDILSEWVGGVDCTIQTRLAVLLKLQDRQQLSLLMRSGELVVEGDITVVQQLVILLDITEWDPAELLVPYFGDIVAQSLEQALEKSIRFFISNLQRQQRYLAGALTEEYKLAPSPLQIAWFNEEVSVITVAVSALGARLALMETKL